MNHKVAMHIIHKQMDKQKFQIGRLKLFCRWLLTPHEKTGLIILMKHCGPIERHIRSL